MANYVIGIDGGGTTTLVMVSDVHCTSLLCFRTGAINYNGSKSNRSIDNNIQNIFRNIIKDGFITDDCLAICIGAAGISNQKVVNQILQNIKQYNYRCPIQIVADYETALEGAIDVLPGLILISGTGSICFGKDKHGQTYRAGGYGHIIDDEGSGYAIAKDILTAIVKVQDKRMQSTVLTSFVYEYLHIDSITDLITYVYDRGRSKKDIAKLAVIINEALKMEDNVAKTIVNKCSNDLVSLATPVLQSMKDEPNITLAVSGSVLLNNTVIYSKFVDSMYNKYPQIPIRKPCHDAAYGAVKLALKSIK